MSWNDVVGQWHEFNEVYAQAAAHRGLSESAFDILYAVVELGDGCSQREIGAAAYLGKQTVNTSVHRLVAEGLLAVEREPHRRSSRVSLTEEGRRFVARAIEPVRAIEQEVFDGLPEQDREAFVRIQRTYLDELRRRMAELDE